MKKYNTALIRHILMAAVILIAVLAWFHVSSPGYPHAENGVLDLSGWDLESGRRITLSGEWEFYWNEFLSYEKFSGNMNPEPVFAEVPGNWNKYRGKVKNLPGFGHATYRLKVRIPDKDTALGLRVGLVSCAYQLYVNDRMLSQSGKISDSPDDYKPGYSPATAYFIPPAREFDVILYVSNYTYARGGIRSNLDFGTEKQINRYESYLKYRDGVVVGILAFMAIYFFCFFYMFREDKINLSFILMCLILIIRSSIYGDSLIMRLSPGMPYELLAWLSYQTLIWFPVVIYQMIVLYVNAANNRKLARPVLIYGILASVMTTAAPLSFYSQGFVLFCAAAVIIFAAALTSVFLAHIKKVHGADIIFTGSLLVGITGFHDILHQANLICTGFGELAPVGMILFMLSLFFLMADRFSKTYHEVQSLSKELENKLKREKDLTERLYAFDKMKDEFLDRTSNELRTALSSIIHIIQSLLHGIGGGMNGVQRHNLEAVLDSSRKLHTMVNELLDVSMLRNGRIPIDPGPIDVHTFMSNLLVIIRHLKNNEFITLYNAVSPDFPKISADEARLRQILGNILDASLKRTKSGTILVSASHDGEWARICIEDTGIYIEPEKLEHLFDAFEQVDGTLRQKHENAELGLYITRQLVELHQGKIWMTSQPGTGSQVYFTMPLYEEHGTGRPSSAAEEYSESPLNSPESERNQNDIPCRILVIDGDFPELQALTGILQLSDYCVIGIHSGREALSLLKNGIPFDLVIIDVMMPELSGFEVLEILRNKYTRLELPVLMLATKAQSIDMSLYFKLGANDYLTKPFEEEELRARVNSLVKLKKALSKLITTEMSFLQAQIKPHFIQNTLSAISSLSIKDPYKAKALILDLSDYLRGSFDLNTDKGLTTLSRELELVRAYLSIEQARFKDRLQVHFRLLENMDCTLPLLTIQPLVENALRHGILCRVEGGEIEISTFLKQNCIRIEVRDNGVGMEPERIAKFFELNQDHNGVGIANVHRRLMVFYGEGLHIESAPGRGTAISFRIPCTTNEEVIE